MLCEFVLKTKSPLLRAGWANQRVQKIVSLTLSANASGNVSVINAPTTDYYQYSHVLWLWLWLWQFEGMIGWYSSSNQAPPQFQPPSTLVALFSFKLCPDVLLHYYLVQFNIEVSSEDQVRVGLISL